MAREDADIRALFQPIPDDEDREIKALFQEPTTIAVAERETDLDIRALFEQPSAEKPETELALPPIPDVAFPEDIAIDFADEAIAPEGAVVRTTSAHPVLEQFAAGAFQSPLELGAGAIELITGEPVLRELKQRLAISPLAPPPEGIVQSIANITGMIAGELPTLYVAFGAAHKLIKAKSLLRLMAAEAGVFGGLEFIRQGRETEITEIARSAGLGLAFPLARLPRGVLGRVFSTGALGAVFAGADPKDPNTWVNAGLMAVFGAIGGSTRDLPFMLPRIKALATEVVGGAKTPADAIKELRRESRAPGPAQEAVSRAARQQVAARRARAGTAQEATARAAEAQEAARVDVKRRGAAERAEDVSPQELVRRQAGLERGVEKRLEKIGDVMDEAVPTREQQFDEALGSAELEATNAELDPEVQGRAVGERLAGREAPPPPSEQGRAVAQEAIESVETEAAEKNLYIDGGPPAAGPVRRMFRRFADWVSVEAPFRRMGFKEVGFRVKNWFSEIGIHEEVSLDNTKAVRKSGISQPQEVEAILASENVDIFNRLEGATKVEAQGLRDYLDEYKAHYKRHGELDADFIDGLPERIEKRLADTSISTTEADALRETLALLRDNKIKFTHIPLALWFEGLVARDPAGARKWMSLNVKQMRKSPTIDLLIKQGKINPEDMKLWHIYASYGRRAGRDLALLEIRKAMENEGMASRKPRKGLIKLPTEMEPHMKFLKNWWVEPTSIDFLNDFVQNASKFHRVGAFLGELKMAQFFNPLFLPMYDVVQGAMLGTFRSLRTPGNVFKGIRSVITKDAAYWQAKADGLASRPFAIPFDEFMQSVQRTAEGYAPTKVLKRMVNVRQKGLLGKIPVLNELYRGSWTMAWKLDEAIRMMSYHHLNPKGAGGAVSREAAQVAAQFHADYASVPPATRRNLNRVFFTPTFKITMFKLYEKMFQGALKTIAQPLTAGKIKATKMDRIRAGGLLSVVAIAKGLDMYMTHQGWSRDVYGVKYHLPVDTEEGPKEITMNFPSPATLVLKYGGRAMNALASKGMGVDAFLSFVAMNRWELHPLWRAGITAAENRNNAVYNPLDIDPDNPLPGAARQLVDVSWFFTKEMVGILRGVSEQIRGGQPESPNIPRPEELKKNLPEMLQVLAMLKLAFPMKRTPAETRTVFQIREIQKEIRRMQRLKQLTPERLENAARRIQQKVDAMNRDRARGG